MRNAPSVRYPVGRSALHALLVGVLAFLGLLSLLLPIGVYPVVPAWLQGGGMVLWGGWLAWAVLSWRRACSGHLQWDARATPAPDLPAGVWRWWPDDGPTVELQSLDWMWDVQNHVLLRLRAPGQRPLWLWLARQRDPLRWDDLRRALTAHAGRRPAS